MARDLDPCPAVLSDGLDGAAAASDEASGLDVGDKEAEGVRNAVGVSPGMPHDRVRVRADGSSVAQDVGEGELHRVEGPRRRYHAVVGVVVEAGAAVAYRHLRPGYLVLFIQAVYAGISQSSGAFGAGKRSQACFLPGGNPPGLES